MSDVMILLYVAYFYSRKNDVIEDISTKRGKGMCGKESCFWSIYKIPGKGDFFLSLSVNLSD